MRYIAINCLLIFLIGSVQVYDLEKSELVPLGFRLDVMKRDLTPKEKEQILNGVNGAKEFMKFLEEKNFFKMLTKISSVAGPIFSVASAVISIAFLFIDVESPEMALMKKEFKNLNNRIDKWSTEFEEIKRKIEWSAVQVDFGDIENTIISLSRMVADFENVPVSIRETVKRRFINSYEIDYKSSGDLLYNAMVNIDQIYSANLFRAAQKFLEFDRNQVQTFMMQLVSLLTQAIQVEAMYVKLKYDSEENSQFVQSYWQKQLAVLKDKMNQVDLETKNMYSTQYQKDLDMLLKTKYSLNNQEFNSMAYNFFTTKYDWRAWFVLVYAEVSGFRDHAVSTCQGTFRFRMNGRNIIVDSVDKSQIGSIQGHMEKNRRVIGSYTNWSSDKQYSRGWVNYMSKQLPSCSDVTTVASVKWGSNVWYSTNLVVYKKNCVRRDSMCFNTFLFA